MEPNPYESPKTDGSEGPPEDGSPPRVVRRGIPAAVAVVWNVPLAAIMVALFRGWISERTMELAMAGWASLIPLVSVALVYVPWLQRLVFVPGIDMAAMRPKLWGLTLLWLAILGIWFIAYVIRWA